MGFRIIAGAVRILGLDRVAGATVRTRESSRQQAQAALDYSSTESTPGVMTVADPENGTLRLDAGEGHAQDLVGAIDGEVPVESEDAIGHNDGFVQVCGGATKCLNNFFR